MGEILDGEMFYNKSPKSCPICPTTNISEMTTIPASHTLAKATMECSTDIDLQYRLPPLVEAIKSSWQLSLQSAATASSLLAGVAAQLMGSNDFPKAQQYPRLVDAFTFVSYAAVLLNASAAVTSLILVDKLARLLQKPAQRGSFLHDVEKGGFVGISNYLDLMKLFGAGKSWVWCLRHWHISLFFGILCLYFQIFLFSFLQGNIIIMALTTLVVVYVALSLVYFFDR
ncbi:hypothetical protein E1B28_011385 [Marasmius oreades]|uniref:Uncharacterized protein n=1 Tax=Marasmius oreades TaxID=181124 RepID=A0A9P7UR55_9AGAR|nr:uncharacterized protein E1B28_011385 [Marasmius oreades]KAG7089731.1 hypothetical protein E1B28_011385 [Marasmius oreades]